MVEDAQSDSGGVEEDEIVRTRDGTGTGRRMMMMMVIMVDDYLASRRSCGTPAAESSLIGWDSELSQQQRRKRERKI